MATQNQKIDEGLEQLKSYVRKSKYIDVLDQPLLCSKYGMPYMVSIFRKEYRQRFYYYLREHTTTVATVSKVTGIPHKYLCEVKFYYEKRGLLKVVGFDKCPTTGSSGVQYISTNENIWNGFELPSNQISLF